MIIEPLLDINNKGKIFPAGTEMKFDCEDGYEMEGEIWIIYCKWDGEWTSKPPTCKQDQTYKAPPPVFCNYPGIDENGMVEEDNEAKIVGQTHAYIPGAELRYLCRAGYEIVGLSNLICTLEGEWSADPPSCRRKPSITVTLKPETCADPGIPEGGSRQNSAGIEVVEERSFAEGESLYFSCKDEDLKLKGDSHITCTSTGWSDPLPWCEKNEKVSLDRCNGLAHCKDASPIGNGQVQVRLILTELLKCVADFKFPVGTGLHYSCDEGYVLQGTTDQICQDNGNWSGEKPRCIEDCGRQAGSIISVEGILQEDKVPWTVYIKMDETGSRCGGVLLDHTTVLTVASCFVDNKHATLYFGKNDIRGVNDDAFAITRNSSFILIHPDFNLSTFENDIAIVKFYPGVSYSEKVQPICIPTLNSSAAHIVPGQIGFAIGRFLTKLGLLSTKLIVALVPIQPSETCTAAFQRRNVRLNITSNTFCGGFTDQDIIICKGASGYPLVFYDRETGRFTLEGLVSSGTSGRCDRPERYTMFTRVSYFLQWILQNREK